MKPIARKTFLAAGLVLALGLLASGCAMINVDLGFTPDQSTHGRIVSQDADRFPHVDPLQLNDEIRAFLDTTIDREATVQSRVEKLQEVLFDAGHLNIQYDDQRTQTAMELFESRSGNCLSVMNFYVAVARYLGVDASFQTVQVRPTWDRRGTFLVLSQHINATGRVNPRHTYVVDFTPEIALQQLTSEIISDQQARALYFNNLGVERMLADDFEGALPYLQNALWIDQQLSIAWNNIGTVYNRLAESDLAEYSYQMAFHVDATNATAINNLARFYHARGDSQRAAAYRQAIARFNRQNPYFHFDQGNHALESGLFEQAIDHYRRAIRLKQIEPVFYLALAQTYDILGNTRMQRQMLSAASQLMSQNEEIYQPSDRKLRFIDSQSILRDTSPGLSVIAN